VYAYVEVKVTGSTSATGSIEVKVNGVVAITLTSVQTCSSLASYNFVLVITNGGMTDFYVLDQVNGLRKDYLGDVTVAELFPNSAGSHGDWSPNVGPFTLTSVNGSGVYQGTITGGGSNAYQGYYFTVSGFSNGANNGTFLCTASSATSLTLSATTVTETHAGSAAFQAIVQAGIHGGIVDGYATSSVGTRPNGELTYLSSSTPGQKHDFGHQTLSLTGSIAAVLHRYRSEKDDAGTRQVAGYCLSGGTEGDGTTNSLSSSEQYFTDVYETDPNTGAGWILGNFNSATFGLQEIS
jgi:hypothetical protein